MKFSISDDLILRIYGIVILVLTLNTWVSISSFALIPVIWIAGLCALIVYHRQLKVAILSIEWIIKIWFSLFFPKFSDPVVTIIGKVHYFILFSLLLMGVESLVTPVDIVAKVSPLGKKCWVVSLIVAVAVSTIINRYRPDKNK